MKQGYDSQKKIARFQSTSKWSRTNRRNFSSNNGQFEAQELEVTTGSFIEAINQMNFFIPIRITSSGMVSRELS